MVLINLSRPCFSLFIHSLNIYLLRAFYVPGALLDAENKN